MCNPDRRAGGVCGSRLVAIGAIAYAAAWFLPAWSVPEANTGDWNWLPGWMAFQLSWEFLITAEMTEPWSQRLLYATCLTNAVMVVALLLPWVRRARLGFGVTLLVCAGVDAVWLRYLAADPIPIGPGCVAWVASFVLVGIGLIRLWGNP